MEIEIDYNLSAGKNAESKYKLRNKYKSKIKGLKKAILVTKKKIELLNKDVEEEKESKNYKKRKIVQKKWYEKFRWFFTSNNLLALSGRDARNNEQLIKKHLEKEDLYFHADVFGAPHTVLKGKGKKITNKDKTETAQFSAIFSSAWKSKIYSVDVYSVKPDQVSKTANSGESLGKGAFVIRGKREYFRNNELKLGVGYSKENGLMSAPLSAIKKYTKDYYIIVPGDKKKSDIAKDLKLRFKGKNISLTVEEIDSILPSGNSKIEETK